LRIIPAASSPTISTSDSLDMDRTYIETPTRTEGPEREEADTEVWDH
jgi:hypothetical protein